MKAFIITIIKNRNSLDYAENCLQSIKDTGSDLDARIFNATVPETLFDVNWTWPLDSKKVCAKSNLFLKPYKTVDNRKRIAAAQSHYRLWKESINLNEPIMILEHDAIFKRKFIEPKTNDDVGAYSINDPRGATFKAKDYHNSLNEGINEVPWVTKCQIPQGMPGHSAYVIKPWAAKKVVEQQNAIGWWPNDAIMCRQLCPWVRVYKPYFTTIQDITSTTSK